MGRFTRDHVLTIGAVVAAVGLVLTALAWTTAYSRTPALDGYREFLEALPGQGERGQDWNVLVMIVGPILLVSGLFYAGEQIVLRRRFERLLDTEKKSEFVSRRKDLEELARRLPTGYRGRIEKKEATFRSMR